MKCFGPNAKDALLWILIWEEVRGIHEEGILLEAEHVKADHSLKNKTRKGRSSKELSPKEMNGRTNWQKMEQFRAARFNK